MHHLLAPIRNLSLVKANEVLSNCVVTSGAKD